VPIELNWSAQKELKCSKYLKNRIEWNKKVGSVRCLCIVKGGKMVYSFGLFNLTWKLDLLWQINRGSMRFQDALSRIGKICLYQVLNVQYHESNKYHLFFSPVRRAVVSFYMQEIFFRGGR
jgi:hypothetical protein